LKSQRRKSVVGSPGYGKRDTGNGIRDTGYGKRDTGYGKREKGKGKREKGKGKREKDYAEGAVYRACVSDRVGQQWLRMVRGFELIEAR